MKTAIIDADSIPYVCAHRVRSLSLSSKDAEGTVDRLFFDIMKACNASQLYAFYSSPKSFRNELFPDYKANRDRSHLDDIFYRVRDYAREKYQIYTVSGLESDDVCAFYGLNVKDSIVCSPDKDLLQLPCTVFNYVKRQTYVVKDVGNFSYDPIKKKLESTGIYKTMQLMLEGDSADNIKGIPGIGPVKAYQILNEYPAVLKYSKDFLMERILREYIAYFGLIQGHYMYNLNYSLINLSTDLNPEFLNLKAISYDENMFYVDGDRANGEEQKLLLPFSTSDLHL